MDQPAAPKCHVPDCGKDALVYLTGRPLCSEHYLENVNELNDLGLTPRGLYEGRFSSGEAPEDRQVREPVEGPRERARNREDPLK